MCGLPASFCLARLKAERLQSMSSVLTSVRFLYPTRSKAYSYGSKALKTFLIIIAVTTVLAAVCALGLYHWLDLGAVEMSGHGFLAMGLGMGFSILLGGGLMALVFYSNRKGHDETAHLSSDPKLPREQHPPNSCPVREID